MGWDRKEENINPHYIQGNLTLHFPLNVKILIQSEAYISSCRLILQVIGTLDFRTGSQY